ncbi:MAG TPA: hypothetical protein VFZ48_03865 [Candidatus Saccharimonadales bacterium]
MPKTGMNFEVVTGRELKKEVVDGGKLPPYFDRHFINTTRQHFVPNGLWVLQGISNPPGYHQRFVGTRTDFERVVLNEIDSNMPRVIWVSKTPFGMLSWDRDVYSESTLPRGGIAFESAWQVHKGRKGRLVPIPKSERVHEVGIYGTRKNSRVAWSQVSELVRVSGLSFTEVIDRFWAFVDPGHNPWHVSPATLRMVRTASAEQIAAQRRTVEEFTKDTLLGELGQDPTAYDNAWVPAPLVRTILRLTALGYQPIVAANA